ncbi:hypothetical protein G9A89_023941 [Geosiphon pyriformis]|nr:hypothetical protein G9A89_023941 [Geosiphon pyriformis]
MQQQYQQPLPIQPYQTPPTQQYQVPTRELVQHNQFTPQNQFQNNNNRINPNNQLVPQNSGQQRPNHYYTQPSYLTIPEKSDFQQSALSEGKVTALRSNPSNNTIPPAQIAQNANLSDIFLFEFEANESPFLLSNAAANEQRAITAMYTKATANANLDWKTQELKISYQGQYTIVSITYGTFNKRSEKAPVFEFEEEKKMPLTETYMALGSTSNWAEETEQEISEESKGWKKVRYSTPEPWKQPLYILLKCKDCNKKLSSMRACIFLEEEYETCTCYFCKACHKERFGSPKKSGKWDNTSCLTCGDIEEVCDQTCQYALSISKKVRRGIPFDAAYNSAFNKLYHYPYNAEMIFDLAMTLINRATQEDVHQMKEAEYIEYTMELAGFNYEDKVETYHQIASHTYST